MRNAVKSRQLALPTVAEAVRYLGTRQPRPARARAAAATEAPATEGQDEGPEIVLALDRGDEFPRVIEQYDDFGWRDPHRWQFEVRVDMPSGRRLYRCWAVVAPDRQRALQRLTWRAAGTLVVTVFAIRPPATLAGLEEIDAANDRLRRFRAQQRPPRSAADLGHLAAVLEIR
jgi:hypothetical protein